VPEEVPVAKAVNTVLVGAVLFVLGIALILWGAERFTDGAVRGAKLLAVSPFFVGTMVSGLEPRIP
jgi:Ca2+/Na+ antiporter